MTDENDIILNKNSAMIIAVNFSRRFDAWKYHNGWHLVHLNGKYFYHNTLSKIPLHKTHEELMDIYRKDRGFKTIKLKNVK